MPRPSRVSEVPPWQTTRSAPRVRTSSSDSDPVRPKLTNPRSPKLGDRRSPRGSQSDPVIKKKFGTRILDLESRLGEAQDELKNLKKQLASAEAAKKQALDELDNKIKKPMVVKNPPTENEISVENEQETDVFEVPMEIVPVESKTDPPTVSEEEKLACNELVLKDDEINLLQSKLQEKEKEVETLSQEHETLKRDIAEKASEISSVRIKQEETDLKLIQIEQELETSKEITTTLNKKLEDAERANEALEAEMKRLRVQTEQWKKAADAAAAVLAGDDDHVDMKGRKVSARHGSMENYGGYADYVGSPEIDDDGYGHGKRKGSGIKMFGDLWKKKGQK